MNDNALEFSRNIIKLNISELTQPWVRFTIESLEDPKVAGNSLQNPHFSSNSIFVFKVKETKRGNKYVELILDKPLDQENHSTHLLVLTALDSGDLPQSGNTQIIIINANDNPLVFNEDM